MTVVFADLERPETRAFDLHDCLLSGSRYGEEVHEGRLDDLGAGLQRRLVDGLLRREVIMIWAMSASSTLEKSCVRRLLAAVQPRRRGREPVGQRADRGARVR